MAKTHEKLAEALRRLQTADDAGIIRSGTLSQPIRERLLRAGFIAPIIKGWYRLADPAMASGETTWFPYYWEFIRQYLDSRFGEEYCLSAESSLLLLGETTTIPRQLVITTKGTTVSTMDLPGGISMLVYPSRNEFPQGSIRARGLNVMALPEALMRVSEPFFRNHGREAAIALHLISDASVVLAPLLEGGRSTVAGRLAGAFRANHQGAIADEILATMKSAFYDVRESNPFDRPLPALGSSRLRSPLEIRLRSLWSEMREPVLAVFPKAPGLPKDADAYMQEVNDKYAEDAYNSLSIEGYRVTNELIARVESGVWEPDKTPAERDALAARGYFEAFHLVRDAVSRLVRGADSDLVRGAHRDWYRALFQPSVQAGILKASDLAGYRNHPVFINNSMHVPPSRESLMDGMTSLFDLLQSEPEASVRAVLGHFIFVFVHPYGDGNGRLGRFLMNAMFASGGFPWTVIHVERRDAYLESLEAASVGGDIIPFAEFIRSEMEA